MVENVKGIGGSGYVVSKDKAVLDQYFPNKGKNVMVLSLALLMLCVGCKQNTDDEDDETDVDKQNSRFMENLKNWQKLTEKYMRLQ